MPKRSRTIFLTGLALYAVSFFLLAASFARNEPGILALDPLYGWYCAIIALVEPWSTYLWKLSKTPFAWAALLLSGLINPVFLITVILFWRQRAWRLALMLAIAVLALNPFCWVVFHDEGLHPREGYFLWVLSMVLVLFSGFSGRRKDVPAVSATNQTGA